MAYRSRQGSWVGGFGASQPTRVSGWISIPGFWLRGFGSVPEEQRHAGRLRRKWKLPDGRVYDDHEEAYEALQKYLEARFAHEIESSRIKATRRGLKVRKREEEKRVSEGMERAALLLREIPLPDVLERLPAPVKARMDPDLVRLAAELAALNQEEDEIITLLFLM